MPGSYCRYCGERCFVLRVVPDSPITHLASCPRGKEHDRKALGVDADTALNPITGKIGSA